MLVHLVLALAMLAPPPSKAAAQKAFNDGQWQTALELYLEIAETPGVHPPHALVGAHDSLRALHDAAPTEPHLCRALELAREVLRRDDLSDSERAYWRELEADDAARAGATCTPATAPSEPVETEPPTPSSDDAPDAATPPPAPIPEGPIAAPAVQGSEPRRPATARIVTGSLLSIAGAGLVGGMLGVLVRREHADEKIAGLTTILLAEDRRPTPAESDAIAAARASYKEDRTTACVLGILGGVSLLTGLALALAPARPSPLARLRADAAGIVYSF
ncbi:hypothetical protein [Nannocystis bainbridge]|uniref:Tetratricopeptide repeat protein n=1 Tax=Nannocystis bainbridge TaxID=2995303 RepID=A0ABT5E6Z9_9BACT|nr:hypothetical protein [Nannocystis bainbridge]MDC0721641.1 hypothetical protein [Nannocystis bainbridge]